MNFDYSQLSNKPVLVIGAAGVDIVGRLRDKLQFGVSNPSRIRSSFGGVARNVAENLARLEQSVRLISAVGSDEDGKRLIARLDTAGVDTSAVIVAKNRPTDSYLAVVDKHGELQLALDDMGCIESIQGSVLREMYHLFKESSLVFLDANLKSPALKTAISLAKRARLPLCVDPTSSLLAVKLRPYLEDLHLVIPNIHEASVLLDRNIAPDNSEDVMDAAKQLVSKGVHIAVITLAQYGVCYATSESYGQISAIHTDIIDPIGCGDAMTAAIIYALMNEINLDDAIRLGVSAATLTLRYNGTVVQDLSLEKLYDQLVI